jgi:transposase
MYKVGAKEVKIEAELGHSKMAFYIVLKRFEHRGTMEGQKSTNCPRKLSERSIGVVTCALATDHRQTLVDITNHSGFYVSTSIVRKALHEVGFYNSITQKKPFLSDAHRRRRLEFATTSKMNLWGVEEDNFDKWVDIWGRQELATNYSGVKEWWTIQIGLFDTNFQVKTHFYHDLVPASWRQTCKIEKIVRPPNLHDLNPIAQEPLENAQRCRAEETQVQESNKDLGGCGGQVEGYPTKQAWIFSCTHARENQNCSCCRKWPHPLVISLVFLLGFFVRVSFLGLWWKEEMQKDALVYSFVF